MLYLQIINVLITRLGELIMDSSKLHKLKVLSGAQLKYIAFISMLIDHTNKALIYPNLTGGKLNVLSDVFDILGRIAFPIFAFLLVEGYFKTRNKWRYLGTLLLFGAISEVPFDMFTSAEFYEKNWSNVMFTLTLMLITIWIIDILKEKMKSLHMAFWYLASLFVILAGIALSLYFSVDYDYHGILIAYFFYLFHGRELLAIPFCFVSMIKEPWALLGYGFVLTYNGERGKQYKLLNYLFYPVHLLILGIIRMKFGI